MTRQQQVRLEPGDEVERLPHLGSIEVKEVKYRPNIDKHDMERKTNRVKHFLTKGKKVKVTIFFRYRQLRRPELGAEILDMLVKEVDGIGTIETRTHDGSR